MDGYVSNEVLAQRLQGTLNVWTDFSPIPEVIYPGNPVPAHDVWVMRLPDETKPEEAGKEFVTVNHDDLTLSYLWYLRNPNTYETTLIEGATGDTYTPTKDQWGYELISEIVGTYGDSPLPFISTHCAGTIVQPIEVSMEYVRKDGFVINTEYVLPNPTEAFYLFDLFRVRTSLPNVVTLKPGQYAVNTDIENYSSSKLCYGAGPYKLCTWNRQWKTYDALTFMDPKTYSVRINVQKDGQSVPSAAVDVIGKDLTGKYKVLETLTDTENSGLITTDLLEGDYLFRAHPVEGTMETYYPNAAVWDEAKTIKLYSKIYSEHFSDENFAFKIDLKSALSALSGNSTITGTISIPDGAKARTRAAGDGVNCTVYLKEKASGNIVAKTPAESNGDYTFLNVPIGEYIVVPDFVGYKAASSDALAASVTEENQIVNLDCTLQAANLPPAEGVKPGDANGDDVISGADVEAVAKYIMGEAVEKFNEDNADANNDGSINIADIVCIVNLF